MPGEQPAHEGTDPKERKDHSRAVEAAADHTEALGFRRLMFHFKRHSQCCGLPRSLQQAVSPAPVAELQPRDSPLSKEQPGAPLPGAARRGEGAGPQPHFSSLEAGRKTELGAEGASGPGSDTSQIREVCGLEPKHRMCSAEEGLGEGAALRHS